MTYQQLRTVSRSMNENRDCAVRAVAIAANVPYRVAHATLKQLGRKNRRGTPNTVTKQAMKNLGFRLEEKFFRAKTVRTLERELRRGVYLVWVRGHILAIKNGVVHDWTKGRCHRVKRVIEVIHE